MTAHRDSVYHSLLHADRPTHDAAELLQGVCAYFEALAEDDPVDRSEGLTRAELSRVTMKLRDTIDIIDAMHARVRR
jgi:hypothetical protein